MRMPRASSHRLRTGRFSHAGLVYMITTSTREREELFRDLEVGRAVVGELIRMERMGLASTLAYVVMPGPSALADAAGFPSDACRDRPFDKGKKLESDQPNPMSHRLGVADVISR